MNVYSLTLAERVLLRQTFPAFCTRGHRLVPSTGECAAMAVVVDPWEAWGGGLYFEHVVGSCDYVLGRCAVPA